MKYYILTILISLTQLGLAKEDNQYIQSDKLSISGVLNDQKPEDWLRLYGAMEPKKEKLIRITAEFDIDKVSAIIITDMNAANNKCGPKRMKDLLYLSFDPAKNLKKITTRIHLPCFVGRDAVFKLRVLTEDNARYFNNTTLTAHPAAFRSWSN